MTTRPLRIGSRGSPLAIVQAEMARRALTQADPSLGEAGALEIVEIRTTGDIVRDRRLADVGGKGLFTRELDEAMLDRRIDLAVHSVKDVPTWLPDGVVLAAVLPRADPRDVLVARPGIAIGAEGAIASLPAAAVVGTASLRRQAQLLHRRPDLSVALFRGNVETRLARVEAGVVDATLLALAGLERLGLAARASAVLGPEESLPAVGQGAVGVTCRVDDEIARALLALVNDAASARAIAAERAMLAALDGSCRTPIGGWARLVAGAGPGATLALDGVVAAPDGSALVAGARSGDPRDGALLGADLGRELRARADPRWFAS